MTKAEKIEKLWNKLQDMEDRDEALEIWYRSLPKKVLAQIETPCWGKEAVEEYYGISLL